MIRRFQLHLDTPLPPHAAYALYAALLEQAPGDFSARVHQMGVTPVSQYVHGDRWYVSLLGQEAVQALSPVLEDMAAIRLLRQEQPIRFLGKEVSGVWGVEQLLDAPAPDAFRLELRTPTAFKSAGHYQLLPTQRLLLQSLILKWNGCFGDICPIEDEGGGLETMASGIRYRAVELDTRDFRIKRTAIPGVVGSIQVQDLLSGFHRQLAAALLEFGSYAGIGIKTALGMGGMTVQKKGEC